MEKKRILIVEDEALVAMDIQASLERLGYEVCDTVVSGEKAISSTENSLPDLVLMDIELAGQMDGMETAAEIRRRFNVPVVYLTAYSDNEILQKAKEAEPNGYLLKPFREAELKSTIEMAFYKHIMETERQRLINELKEALANVKQLSGMLPICAGCKKIRDDKGYWNQIEVYIRDHSEAEFTHGLCPDCEKKAYEELDRLKKERDKNQR